MLLECGHCGAPLDVREGTRITKCAYCGKSSQTHHLRTVAVDTPAGWRPPKQWTPPAHVPADSNQVLAYHAAQSRSAVLGIVGAIVALGVSAGVMAIFAKGRVTTTSFPGPSGDDAFSAARLAEIDLASTASALAHRTAARVPSTTHVRVPLDHAQFQAVIFRWDPRVPGHVRDFHFESRTGRDTRAARAYLAKVLGRRFDDGRYSWAGLSISVTDSSVQANVTIPNDDRGDPKDRWKARTKAAWSLLRGGLLEIGAGPKRDELRAHLPSGEPLTLLSAIDAEADIDQSGDAVTAVFPAATRRLLSDLEWTVPIAHPWFAEAALSWRNEAGAKSDRITLRPWRGAGDGFADQAAIDRCIEGVFGKPTRGSTGPHIGGSRDTTWKLVGGEVRVYKHLLVVRLRDGRATIARAKLEELLERLTSCAKD